MFDVAVVIPSLLRPHLEFSVRSIYNQQFNGTVQILVGVDYPCEDRSVIKRIQPPSPNHHLTVVDLGYSTRKDKGGLYYTWAGGSMRSLLTLAANSQYVCYLDDDCWYESTHIADLLNLIKQKNADWVHSQRRAVHWETDEHLPSEILYVRKGDTNCIMIDKIKCHHAITGWTRTESYTERFHHQITKGRDFSYRDDEDFRDRLKELGLTNEHYLDKVTVNYRLNPDSPIHSIREKKLKGKFPLRPPHKK